MNTNECRHEIIMSFGQYSGLLLTGRLNDILNNLRCSECGRYIQLSVLYRFYVWLDFILLISSGLVYTVIKREFNIISFLILVPCCIIAQIIRYVVYKHGRYDYNKKKETAGQNENIREKG